MKLYRERDREREEERRGERDRERERERRRIVSNYFVGKKRAGELEEGNYTRGAATCNATT